VNWWKISTGSKNRFQGKEEVVEKFNHLENPLYSPLFTQFFYRVLIILVFYLEKICIFAGGKREVDFSDLCQKWAYYIGNIGKMDEDDVKGETGIFLEFINDCRMSNLNEAEMREYKKSVMDYADVRDACVAAKEDGFAEGKKLIVARMLAQKLSIDAICDLTGLTEEEIRGIMVENNA
jgi:hypothetical protein